MVVFEKGRQVLIESVGPGYDVGDLTRGKAVHTSLTIPWDFIFENPRTLFRQAQQNFRFFNISQENYEVSRKNRIEEAAALCGMDRKEEIAKAIPTEVTHLNNRLFNKIYRECIEKIILKSELVQEPIGLIMNIYEGQFCIFEIWQSARSAY